MRTYLVAIYSLSPESSVLLLLLLLLLLVVVVVVVVAGVLWSGPSGLSFHLLPGFRPLTLLPSSLNLDMYDWSAVAQCGPR